MHRRKGRRQDQAKGLTGALRQRLLEATGEGLIDARNRALLAVAYDTLLRRGELVALQVSDIVEEVDGAATVLVRRSKADPEGRGATVYLARDSVALVREWRERSGVSHGRLFRSLARGAVGEGLDASQVPRIFKAMAERAGLPVEVVQGISGHSTRVGAAQDMVAGGIGMAAILHAGRWKTPGDGQPLRRGAARAAKRGGAARAPSASRVGARRRIMGRTHLGPGAVSPPGRARKGPNPERVIASRIRRPASGRAFRARGTDGAGRAPRTRETVVESAGCMKVWRFSGCRVIIAATVRLTGEHAELTI